MTLRSCLVALATTAALAASARADDRVLILPFTTLNVPANEQWMATAAQESLVADLGQVKGVIPIAFKGQVIVEDNETAARLARAQSANYAIRGSTQVVGTYIRLTAQLIDARSGDTLRTALVTGATADLFRLEDDLAAQICGVTAAATNAVTAVAATTPATTAGYVGPVVQPTPIVIENPVPQVVVVPEPYYVPTYVYPYDYSYYYPFGYGFITYDFGHDHDRDCDRDHDGRGGRPGGRDDRGRPGDRGGGPGPRLVNNDNPTALPIPTNNVLPIPTHLDLPIPTRSVTPSPARSASPLAGSRGSSSVPVVAHREAAPRLSPTVNLPAASERLAVPTRSAVVPTRNAVVPTRSAAAPMRNAAVPTRSVAAATPAVSRAVGPRTTPAAPRASGGSGRGSGSMNSRGVN